MARGSQVTVWLNGEHVSHFAGATDRQLRGYLGLQAHHPGSRVSFRNLRIHRLE